MIKKYVVSLDGEDWSGGFFDTRDEAIKSGIEELEGVSFWIGETRPPVSPDSFFNGWSFVEEVSDHEDYSFRDAPWMGDSNKVEEFEYHIRKSIEEWLRVNGLTPTHFVVENEEKIEPREL